MKLSIYKERYSVNIQDLAAAFGVPHQTMYYWIKAGAEITGKKGERIIYKSKELRREMGTEKQGERVSDG